jgi:hypothetical protein
MVGATVAAGTGVGATVGATVGAELGGGVAGPPLDSSVGDADAPRLADGTAATAALAVGETSAPAGSERPPRAITKVSAAAVEATRISDATIVARGIRRSGTSTDGGGSSSPWTPRR